MSVIRRLAHLAGALVLAHTFAGAAGAAEDGAWRHGVALVGELKYAPDFTRFDYVDASAPKGGDLNLSENGTFDTFNPLPAKGELVTGVGLVFDTLMKQSLDEESAAYGLLAEALSYPDDLSSVTFRLRANAKFADGSPVTAQDVVFSMEKVKELNPQQALYYQHVTKAEALSDREVKFTFDEKGNRELPFITGELMVVSKAWWTAADAKGKARDVAATTLEPLMGSGPYRIAQFSPGSTIRYELRPDYWAKDLPVNKGQNNFASITYSYFGDRDVEFEAFRSGSVDFWQENEAKRWATAYDFPAVAEGKVKREMLENAYRRSGVMVGFIPNLRRPIFADARLREALNYAFDFEELNRTVFFGQYERIDSYFYGTEFVAKGAPDADEQALIESLKPDLPAGFTGADFDNPKGGTPALFRDNLRKAVALFGAAGYGIKDGRMLDQKTGKPLTFEILLNGPTLERVALPFSQNLKRIGVEVSVRTVDAAQYTNRVRAFDYDMIYSGWGQSINPGNEQSAYWGSKAADEEGSRNYAGIKDKAIDAVVQKVIYAPDRKSQITAVKVLDRLLLAGHYIVPGYTLRKERLAYWDRFERPAELPQYSSGFPDIWWSKAAR